MTCKDCISYGKEVNIDDKTYHLCTDRGDLMTAEEEDDMFAMCGRFKPKMTCKDCIYYDNKIQEKTGIVEYHICSRDSLRWKWAKNIDKPCKQFERKENSWESVSK